MKGTTEHKPGRKPARPAGEIAADLLAQAQKMLDAAAALKGKDLKLQTKIKR
jgi:hypothetical protein